MAAVAETAGTRQDFLSGGLRVVRADITSVDDGDTWAPGLRYIEFATFTNTTANPSASQVNLTWASSTQSVTSSSVATVTFDTEAAGQTGTVVAWGY